MAQWYYSINFETLGKDQIELTAKISKALGYEPEGDFDENPRWECKHTAYEAFIEPVLKEVCFSGRITSDGEVSGYPVQVWTLEEGIIRLIEEYDDSGSVVREEKYDKNGNMISSKTLDENGQLTEESPPSFSEQFQTSKILYEMGLKDGNETMIRIATDSLHKIMTDLEERDSAQLTSEDHSTLEQIKRMVL